MAADSGAKPFVTSFQGKTQISSSDFLKIFKSFDKDGKFTAFYSAVLFFSFLFFFLFDLIFDSIIGTESEFKQFTEKCFSSVTVIQLLLLFVKFCFIVPRTGIVNSERISELKNIYILDTNIFPSKASMSFSLSQMEPFVVFNLLRLSFESF